jgi:hypothetical protein
MRKPPIRKVVRVHLRSGSWLYSDELECGHYVDYKTYTLRHPKTRRCVDCLRKSPVAA